MTTRQKITIGLIAVILFGVGYNLFLIKNGNTNTAVFGGIVPSILGTLIGYNIPRKGSKEK